MPYGIQDDGSFDRKHIDAVVDSLETKIKQESGNVDLNQSSPVKQALDTFAIEIARLWEAQETNYYAAYYEDAFGEHLDRILKLAGVSRVPRRPATGEVTFSTDTANNEDVTIPSGFEVATSSTPEKPSIPFRTTQSKVLSAGETSVTMPIRGMQPWETDVGEEWLGAETNVSAGAITRIASPLAGVDSVSNTFATGDDAQGYTPGRDRETDAELKTRYENSLSQAGDATLDSIRSQIVNDTDVVNVAMRENTSATDNTGSGGLPAKSFQPVVYYTGALEDDIAQAILDSRAAGIESYGNTTGNATTEDGAAKTESFQSAAEVNVVVDVSVTTTNEYPSNGSVQIEDRIVAYIGGVDNSGVEYPGTEIGDTVIYDQVFAAVMRVDGVQETDVQIKKSGGTLGTSNLTVGTDEVARTALADITVTEV